MASPPARKAARKLADLWLLPTVEGAFLPDEGKEPPTFEVLSKETVAAVGIERLAAMYHIDLESHRDAFRKDVDTRLAALRKGPRT